MKVKDKDILCDICGIKIGIEISGRQKYYDRPGSYYYCNTIMGKNAANQEYCKHCYEQIKEAKCKIK